jgi:hypothetical protein
VADIVTIMRPQDVPENGLFCDLLWADPDPDVDDWTDNERGTSYCFGPQQAREFLENFDFSMICRAHQLADDGYEYPFGEEIPVVTLFSAPNYCYEYRNQAAIMQVDAELRHTFKQFEWEEAPHIELPTEGAAGQAAQPEGSSSDSSSESESESESEPTQEAPAEVPLEVPVEVPVEVPLEAQVEVEVEVSLEVEVEVPVEVEVEVEAQVAVPAAGDAQEEGQAEATGGDGEAAAE